MILEECHVAITPFDNGYRVGSTMEFAGYDTTLNRQRLNYLRSGAAEYLIEPTADPVEEEWYGWRPMTADGIPFIDRSPRFKNVWVAAGHSMLGISMGTGTGKLVAEMISGQKPHVDTGRISHSAIAARARRSASVTRPLLRSGSKQAWHFNFRRSPHARIDSTMLPWTSVSRKSRP